MAKAKNPAAVSLGQLGGTARAAKLTPEQRAAIATKASHARTVKKGWPAGTARGPRKPKP